jgi:hypothetical protein
MFKAPSPRVAAPFAAAIFFASFLLSLYAMWFHDQMTGQFVVASAIAAFGIAFAGGSAFWVGLGFSHHEPAVGKAVLIAAGQFFFANTVASLLGRTVAFPVFLGFLIALSLLYGARWPEAWANKSFNATVTGGDDNQAPGAAR